MKYLYIAICITIIIICITIAKNLLLKEVHIDKRTKELCLWYAMRDHEKELAPERWQWFIEQGVNPNDDFDWYTSCINHHRYPVAK